MKETTLSVRELQLEDLHLFTSYWLNASESYLAGMGVDITKLPTKEAFFSYWKSQLEIPLQNRASYCIIWLSNNVPIGHSNTRPTQFGEKANMHLHLWSNHHRGKGMGYEFVKLTVQAFFEKLRLKDLYCEPYAFNAAPNEVLKKAGFNLMKEYLTIPGPSNFPQQVKLWHLSRDKFDHIYKTST